LRNGLRSLGGIDLLVIDLLPWHRAAENATVTVCDELALLRAIDWRATTVRVLVIRMSPFASDPRKDHAVRKLLSSIATMRNAGVAIGSEGSAVGKFAYDAWLGSSVRSVPILSASRPLDWRRDPVSGLSNASIAQFESAAMQPKSGSAVSFFGPTDHKPAASVAQGDADRWC
jgi:hypothetical protein